MSGFWRLSNARPAGFSGPLRIPFAEIAAYCQLQRYDHEKTQDFLFYVEKLDERYMAFVKKLQEEEELKNGKNATPGKPGTKGSSGPRR